jgi:hypothetical protein
MPGEILIVQGIQQVMSGETGQALSVFFSRYLVFVFAFLVAILGFGASAVICAKSFTKQLGLL